MVQYYYRNSKSTELITLDKYKVGCWIHVENPTEKELIALSEKLNIETDICLDALDPFEVPRIEKEDGSVYIFTRFANKSGDKITTSPLLFVIASNFIMTVSVKPLPFLHKFLSSKIDFRTDQRTNFIIQLYDEIHKDYQRLTNAIHKNIRNLSRDLEDIDNKDINKFVKFETIINDFLFGLEPISITLKKLLSGKYTKLYEEDEDLIEDLFVDNEQLVRIAKTNLKGIVNIREAHSAIVSNNLNKTMKLLTSVTLILTVPTMVSSFYGMNVDLPFQGHPLAFLGVLALTTVISFSLLAFFNKRDLL